jgi:hypothetical protein
MIKIVVSNNIIIMNDSITRITNCLFFIVPFVIILSIIKLIIDTIISIVHRIFGNPYDA